MEKEKKVKIDFLVIGIVMIITILGITGTYIYKNNLKKSEKTTEKESIQTEESGSLIISKEEVQKMDDSFVYKIRYDFGMEHYIYVLPNNIIKTLDVSEIHDIQEDCNCLVPTGEYRYEEKTIKSIKK